MKLSNTLRQFFFIPIFYKLYFTALSIAGVNMEQANTKTKTILLYIARLLNAVSLSFLVFMVAAHLIGIDEKPNSASIEYLDFMMMVFFPLGTMIGLVVCWFRGQIGGYIIVACIIVFHILDLLRGGDTDFMFFIDINAFIGFLFIISTCKRK